MMLRGVDCVSTDRSATTNVVNSPWKEEERTSFVRLCSMPRHMTSLVALLLLSPDKTNCTVDVVTKTPRETSVSLKNVSYSQVEDLNLVTNL